MQKYYFLVEARFISKINMKKILSFWFLTIVHWQVGFSQFKDDFSDDDFSTNPAWNGDDAKFIVDANRLKLQAPAVSSTAFLSTSSNAIDNTSWEFYVQMDFNPSSANQAYIYLVSNSGDLTASLNGYFVKIGNTTDEVSLYRQDGVKEIEIIDGLDGKLNLSTVKVNIKVTRDNNGNWQLFSDPGLGIYTQEGVTYDDTYQVSEYFGIRCEYSATRSDKFYFDNFIISTSSSVDTTLPILEQARVTGINELELIFSKQIEMTEAENVVNYSVNCGLLNPTKAILYPDQRTVKLTFSKNFSNGIICQLSICGVKDIVGNVIGITTKEFLYFQPFETIWRDVIVTEIFSNPNPVIGLPEAEYIELLNRGENPVDLDNWSLTDGTSIGRLTSMILLPNEYVVLTSLLNQDKFSLLPRVMGIKNFPTLNNSGDVVILKDAFGSTIDSLHYTDKWYQDDDKKEGGWSLELIDPNNICAESSNWIASENKSGGTPCNQNSVYANKPDLTGPGLNGAVPISSQTVLLEFNEKLDKANIFTGSISFEPLLTVQQVFFTDQSLTSLTVAVKENFQRQTTYTVTANNIYDCSGNTIQSNLSKANFGLPERADSLDVLVNEILFNPTRTGVDFVEIYNNSGKFINLKNWTVSNINDGVIMNSKVITYSNSFLKPFTYLVFTENVNVLKNEYPLGVFENFLEVKTLPDLNDDAGSVAISDENGNIINSVSYTKSMHSAFIKNEEGVSLERISFDDISDLQNWRSASAIAGYATPGYRNSNARPENQILEESVTIDPEIFIPATDFTQVKYKFDKGGYVANVKVCDIDGREIKRLANNETLDTSGYIRWDGDSTNGNKARVGCYFVLFEIFDTSGVVKSFRKRVVVATHF